MVLRRAALAAYAFGLLVPAALNGAARPARGVLRAAPLGPMVEAPNGRDVMELVRFDESVTATLLTLVPNESIRVEEWPVAPGERASVVMTRFDVYAPDAKVVVVAEPGRTVEVPRSRLVFYRGHVESSGEWLLASIEPETGSVAGVTHLREATYELKTDSISRRVLLGTVEALRGPDEAKVARCGQEDLGDEDLRFTRDARGPKARVVTSATPIHPDAIATYTVIAVDTDNELLQKKFSDNLTNATNYIADLVAQTSIIYERDASIALRLGYTILRPSSVADPYDNGTANASCVSFAPSADCPKLSQFGEYWRVNYPDVKRSLVALLSGKETSMNSSSGIAWINLLCEKGFIVSGPRTAGGYSFSQVFWNPAAGASSDLLVVPHEIGHNFGSPHTHSCSYGPNNPIDQCVAWEGQNASCTFPGASCPAPQMINGVTNVTGTLMSYCHLSGLPSCTSKSVFHPRTISEKLSPAIAVASIVGPNRCVFDAIGGAVPTAPTISVSGVSPPSGVLAGGNTVTVTGADFVSGAVVTFVELPSNNVFGGSPNEKPGTGVLFNSSSSLTVTVPSATNVGAVDVIVQNPDQQTATLRNGYTYTVTPPAPTVTSVTPNFGPAASTTPVTITGAGFAAGPSLGATFGGTPATGVAFVNSTTLTATAPIHAAGTVNVVVTNGDGQTGTLTNGFFYSPAATATRWNPLTPCRVLDTRNANGPLGGPALTANGTRSFTVTGTCAVPVTAKSVTVNYTVTQGTAAGELRIFAGDGIWTGTSAVSFKVGATRANNGHLLLSTNGAGAFQVTNASAAAIHFILDVNGYYQ